MTRADVSDYLDLIHMPSGRHVFALTLTRSLVADELSGSSPLLPVIDDGIAAGREALRIEFDWQAAKKLEADTSRGDAMGLKQQITRELSGMYDILNARARGNDDVSAKARELLAAIFPNGVKPISSQTFELMLGTLQTMLADHLKGDLAKAVETVGVQREVGILSDLTDRFAQALHPRSKGQVTHDDVQAAQHTLHEATSEVVVEILHATLKRNFTPPDGSAPMKDVDRVRLREALLAPINFQQELVSEAYSRHTQPLDVNPDTGEQINPDASGGNPSTGAASGDQATGASGGQGTDSTTS